MKSERTFILSNNNEIEDLLANYRKIDQYLGFTRQISENAQYLGKSPNGNLNTENIFSLLTFNLRILR